MPPDKAGRFHLNVQKAHASDKAAESMTAEPARDGAEPGTESKDTGVHTTLHDHQDGTYHTEGHDGEQMEHESIHGALAHIAAKHGHEDLHAHVLQHEGQEAEHGGY